MDTPAFLAPALAGVLALAGAALPAAARADVELDLGVYAYDEPTATVWSCPAVVRAMERRMGRTLDEEVTIEVHLDADYQRGVEDLTEGVVQVARFPNVDTFWVLHPGLAPRVVDAWREAMVGLRLEEILAAMTRTVALAELSGDGEPAVPVETLEERFGGCEPVYQRLSRSADPARERVFPGVPFFAYAAVPGLEPGPVGDRLLGEIESLPASAAGPGGWVAPSAGAGGDCEAPRRAAVPAARFGGEGAPSR